MHPVPLQVTGQAIRPLPPPTIKPFYKFAELREFNILGRKTQDVGTKWVWVCHLYHVCLLHQPQGPHPTVYVI